MSFGNLTSLPIVSQMLQSLPFPVENLMNAGMQRWTEMMPRNLVPEGLVEMPSGTTIAIVGVLVLAAITVLLIAGFFAFGTFALVKLIGKSKNKAWEIAQQFIPQSKMDELANIMDFFTFWDDKDKPTPIPEPEPSFSSKSGTPPPPSPSTHRPAPRPTPTTKQPIRGNERFFPGKPFIPFAPFGGDSHFNRWGDDRLFMSDYKKKRSSEEEEDDD